MGADAETDAEPTTTIAGASDTPTAACAELSAAEEGMVELDSLIETSGLAASQRFAETFWAHNDSGQATAIHAISAGGAHRATFELDGIDGVDIEDMAVVGDSVYLADIGDNNERRDHIAIYRFDEPDPAPGDGSITEVDVFRFRYPDGARDAEAFMVDPLTNEFVIIEKAFGFGSGPGLVSPRPATVYVAPPASSATPAPDGQVVELIEAGTAPMDQLATQATSEGPADAIFTNLGLEGVATAADIRADGRLIAIRTYATVWLFDRQDGETVAEALTSAPCEAPTIVEDQGEAVAFLDGTTSGFVTVSEGQRPAWNVTAVRP